MTEILSLLATIVPPVVTALILVLAVIAPLTKSEYDNKALAALRWFEAAILKVLFPNRTLAPKA